MKNLNYKKLPSIEILLSESHKIYERWQNYKNNKESYISDIYLYTCSLSQILSQVYGYIQNINNALTQHPSDEYFLSLLPQFKECDIKLNEVLNEIILQFPEDTALIEIKRPVDSLKNDLFPHEQC